MIQKMIGGDTGFTLHFEVKGTKITRVIASAMEWYLIYFFGYFRYFSFE